MGDYENALLNFKKALKIKEETLTMRKYRACELRVPIFHRHGFTAFGRFSRCHGENWSVSDFLSIMPPLRSAVISLTLRRDALTMFTILL